MFFESKKKSLNLFKQAEWKDLGYVLLVSEIL
jgi:hypothetical protein